MVVRIIGVSMMKVVVFLALLLAVSAFNLMPTRSFSVSEINTDSSLFLGESVGVGGN